MHEPSWMAMVMGAALLEACHLLLLIFSRVRICQLFGGVHGEEDDGVLGFADVVVVRRGPVAGGGRGGGYGGALATVLQRHIQLRRLLLRHGELRHHQLRQAAQHAQVPAAVRALLQRPPRHRLPRRGARPAAAAAVGEQGHQLQPGRQLRGDGRHRAGPPVLQGQQRVEHPALQHLHERPAPVVPGDQGDHLLVPARVQGPVQQGPVRVRRVRRQRLQLRVEGGLEPGQGEDDGAQGGGVHDQRRGVPPRRGRAARGGPWKPPRRLHPHHPHHVLLRGPQRVRPPHRLPQEVQQRRPLPQRPAPHRPRPAPAPPPRLPHRLRRLLHSLHPVRPHPSPLRVQEGSSEGVLRRRRAVQLQHERVVRAARRDDLRRPGRARELGRHPPHGGALPLHRQHLAQGPLRAPAARQRRPRRHGLLIGARARTVSV